MTKIEHHDEMYDQLQNKVWDLDSLRIEGYDMEVIFISSEGV